MIEKTLDVTELPIAKTVNDGDQLLLVRPNGDGTKTAMRIEGAALKQTKVKKVQEQYVIGHAVKPRACDQGHMVNWYVFGTVDCFGEALVYIPIQSKVIKGASVHVEKVYIKFYCASDDSYYEVASNNKHIAIGGTFSICSFFINDDDEIPYEYANQQKVIGIRVDRYEAYSDGHVSTVWLSWRCVSRNIKTASTHHWFEGGYRQYKPIDGDRSFIAQRINPQGDSFLHCFSDLEYEAIICKKMYKYNTPGQDKRKEDFPYIRRLVFKRLNFNKQDTFLRSHAKCVGGLYRAIPIYSVCKTKGRPVYFYIRKMVRHISAGNYKTIWLIEWK